MHEGNESITRFGQRRVPAGAQRQLRSEILSRSGPSATPPRRSPPPRAPRRPPIDLDHMYGGFSLSALWHALIVLLVVVGIPNLFKHPPAEPMPIAVKLVNASELTRATQRNPHPVKEAKVETPPPEVPNPEPAPPVETPAPPPPSAPPPSAAPPPTEPIPDVAPPKPTPAPAPPPPPAPTPEPRPAPPPPPPKPQPKPEPPKEAAKAAPPKPPEKAKEDQAFDDLLKNLTHQQPVSKKTDQPPKPQKQKPAAQQVASAQPDAPLGSQLTTSERDMLVQQIEQCWNFDPGAKGAEDLKVEIHIDLDESGTIINSQIVDRARLASDPVWRVAAESAYRATMQPACHALKVPADKYQTWKSITLVFDPKDLQ